MSPVWKSDCQRRPKSDQLTATVFWFMLLRQGNAAEVAVFGAVVVAFGDHDLVWWASRSIMAAPHHAYLIVTACSAPFAHKLSLRQ